MSAYFATFEPAQLDDLLHIEQSVYPSPWSRNNFLDSYHSGYHFQILRTTQDLLAYFVATHAVDEVHLLNFTVAPAYQRQGWARLMLEALTTWSRDRGARWLWLEVRATNARALGIYERFGFAAVGRRKAYYPEYQGVREDAILMSMML